MNNIQRADVTLLLGLCGSYLACVDDEITFRQAHPGSEGTQLFRDFSGNDGRQGRLIKTLGNLQDLSRRIYRKRKAEVVGGCGVDAGEKS
jgi:hypothetical protein